MDVEELLLAGLQHAVHLYHHSDFPETTFTLCQSATGTDVQQQQEPVAPVCAVSDRNFDKILNKMRDVLTPKVQATVHCRGDKFSFGGDFLLKVGTASVGTSFKAVLVEVIRPSLSVLLSFQLVRSMC